jgi:zinc finger BED domain-containing protein 1 (E3 SUMO-protein ligase ZBED1)
MYKIKQKSDRARYWFGRIENRYLSYGSQRDIVSATSDGGANVKCAAQKELGFLWVYCLSHLINRSVRLGLDSTPVKGIIKKAKAISKLFKASPNAARSLRQKQEALKIPIKNLKIDNKTRWSSAYKMVKRMCQSRPAISSCCLATLTGTRRRISP